MSFEHIKNGPKHNADDPSISEALQEIDVIQQREQARGRIDSELDAFNAIRTNLLSGKISPLEARQRANGIADSRQDY